MITRNLQWQLIGLLLMVILLSGCGAATPTPEPPTNTPEPPTSTPEPTQTSVPPTPEPPTTTPTPQPSSEGKLELGQLEISEITSQALAGNLIGDPATREFRVHLPPGYDTSDKHYPVVYALHGFVGGPSELGPMRRELDKLIASGEAGEMILVFPDGSNKFGGSWYLSSPTIGDYESYIVRELVAHIDANYRTISDRDSRGITGCSMGGNGAIHLALKYPDVFSVAVPMSATYDIERDLGWENARHGFKTVPEDFSDLGRGDISAIDIQWFMAGAAAAASNPDKPPFYLDMPFEVVDGEGQIVPEVWEKINAVDAEDDVRAYLEQPLRLRGLMIYHGAHDGLAPVEVARDFDKMLTELGVEHDYVESDRSHCNLIYTPVLKFMSEQLAF